ncbi:heterokaryon incompatibility protein-domain-containing protein [Phyllosticta capitalensis]
MPLRPSVSLNDGRHAAKLAYLDGTSKALHKRLFARAGIPELDTLELPDDWRADQARDPKQSCTTCHWNGFWDQILQLDGSRIPGLELDAAFRPRSFQKSSLQKSASNGNLCCAIFLALSRKFDVEEHESEWCTWAGVEIDPPWLRSSVVDIYISCHSPPNQAPPGALLYPNGGHKSIDTRSEESLAWAKRHIEDCVNTHNCRIFGSKETELPTRLVYIPKDAQTTGVRLVQDTASLPKDTRYAALSHCWGNLTPPCLTTTKNIDKYAIYGIPWAQIPPTFRDAMLYARRLDLDFIWIDSMCIIQGADGDWGPQSTRMFQYYSNAFVTLASTFSSDCNGGLFSERHINTSRLYLLDVRFRGQSYPVYGYYSLFEQGFTIDIYEKRNMIQELGDSFQLLRRAWIYQERLVSPRLLLFSEKQLIFECFGGRCFQENTKTTLDTYKRSYGDSLSNTAGETAESSWPNLLDGYGALKITYAEDKLPAIAAVAKQFLSRQKLPHTPEHEYVCGLRRSHLHIDLMWTAKDHYGRKADPKLFWRGDSYLAPSWSWASVPRETNYSGKVLRRVEKISKISLKREHLDFAGGDRFGRVFGGYITLEGPACDCWSDFTFNQDSVGPLDMWKACYLHLTGDRRWSKIRFCLDVTDIQPSIEEQVVDGKIVKKLTLLQTFVSMDGKDMGFLVLYRNGTNGRYRRVGAGSAYIIGTADWTGLKIFFEQAERRELEIE